MRTFLMVYACSYKGHVPSCRMSFRRVHMIIFGKLTNIPYRGLSFNKSPPLQKGFDIFRSWSKRNRNSGRFYCRLFALFILFLTRAFIFTNKEHKQTITDFLSLGWFAHRQCALCWYNSSRFTQPVAHSSVQSWNCKWSERSQRKVTPKTVRRQRSYKQNEKKTFYTNL